MYDLKYIYKCSIRFMCVFVYINLILVYPLSWVKYFGGLSLSAGAFPYINIYRQVPFSSIFSFTMLSPASIGTWMPRRTKQRSLDTVVGNGNDLLSSYGYLSTPRDFKAN